MNYLKTLGNEVKPEKVFSIPTFPPEPNKQRLTFIERNTRSCLWNSARTETRSDRRSRETEDRMNRSNRTGSAWSLLSSLATIKPSLPISFLRLHIDKLGREAERETQLRNRYWESRVSRESSENTANFRARSHVRRPIRSAAFHMWLQRGGDSKNHKRCLWFCVVRFFLFQISSSFLTDLSFL